jgi:uncharacterized protein
MTATPVISDKRRALEILGVLFTGLGKFLFMDWLAWKLPFILFAILSWVAYLILRERHVPGMLRYWGFRTDTFREALLMVLPFAVVSFTIFFAVGFYRGTINMTWNIIPVLILYPIWGTIQQFLVIGLVAGNLKDLSKNSPNHASIIFVTALLFGLLHYPFYWLVVGTFILALFYGYVYLRIRNIYVLGIFHGWLGGLFFYTVVGRDPFAEVFSGFY